MKNNKGFTLVELLAVIVILALLMVVGTRAIGGSLSDSKRNALVVESSKLLNNAVTDLNRYLVDSNSLDSNTLVTKVGDNYVYTLKEGDFNGYAIFDSSVGIVGFCLDYNRKSDGSAEYVIGKSYATPNHLVETLKEDNIIDNKCCKYSIDSGEATIDMTTNSCT